MRFSLFVETKKKIVKLIKSKEIIINNNQLESEEILSQKLDVSRATIREVLATLSNEGIISKVHGLGNFVHFSAIETKMRIDSTREFTKLIEESGFESRTEIVSGSFKYVSASEIKSKTSGFCDDEKMLYFEVNYYANEIPAITCHIYVPAEKINEEPSIEMEENIFKFLELYSNEKVTHTIVWLKSKTVTPSLQKLFELETGTSLLYWEEKYFNLKDESICYNEIFFNPEIMNISMLRKNGYVR